MTEREFEDLVERMGKTVFEMIPNELLEKHKEHALEAILYEIEQTLSNVLRDVILIP